MLKVKLKSGYEYPVLPTTAIYPSYSADRNRMEICMAEDSMSITEFEKLFNEYNTSEIHLIDTENGSDVAYYNYSIVSSIGKRRKSSVSVESAQPVTTVELVVVLEQLSYLEIQLKNLGVVI